MFSKLISNITDVSIFTESLSGWISDLSVNSIIVMIMMIFMIIGVIDKIRGNRLGYGAEFDEGFQTMGPLAAAMAGVIAGAPVLSMILTPLVSPLYTFFGADASMFAGTLLGCDMGGYPLAMEMADDEGIGCFSGLILGAMMGSTLVFTIPVALGIIGREDRSYLGAGILAGLVTIPAGCIAGGLAMNITTDYTISLLAIVINLIPVIIISGLIAAGLWFAPEKMINGFNVFGKGVTVVVAVLTAVAVFEYETGIKFPLFSIMVEPDESGDIPLETGLLTCGQISIVLIGAFPMVRWITRTFSGPLGRIGKKLGMNEAGYSGIIATMANNIAMFNIMHRMNPRSKVINVAFAVSAAFVLGDHIGFTASVDSDMIFPVFIGQMTGGVTALILAHFMAPMLISKAESASEHL